MDSPEPRDEEMKSVPDQAAEVFRTGARTATDAVASLREPDMPLDLLARLARENPLAAIGTAFIAGYMLARRRR